MIDDADDYDDETLRRDERVCGDEKGKERKKKRFLVEDEMNHVEHFSGKLFDFEKHEEKKCQFLFFPKLLLNKNLQKIN